MNRLITFLSILFLLTSCGSMDEISEDVIPRKVSAYTKDYIEKLAKGDTNYCYNQLDDEFQDDNARIFFKTCFDNLKDKKFKKSAIINYRYTTMFGEDPTTKYEIGFEYEYEDSWVYYSFILFEKDGQLNVYGFNVSPYENSLRAVHQFTLKGKGIVHYFFLFMIVAIPLFILISIGFSVKTSLKKKWLWIIFMLFGFVSFDLNWTNGEFGIMPISFKLLGAGFVKSGVIAPWIVSFSIPIGAILFWFKRSKIRRELKTQKFIEMKENDEADYSKN